MAATASGCEKIPRTRARALTSYAATYYTRYVVNAVAASRGRWAASPRADRSAARRVSLSRRWRASPHRQTSAPAATHEHTTALPKQSIGERLPVGVFQVATASFNQFAVSYNRERAYWQRYTAWALLRVNCWVRQYRMVNRIRCHQGVNICYCTKSVHYKRIAISGLYGNKKLQWTETVVFKLICCGFITMTLLLYIGTSIDSFRFVLINMGRGIYVCSVRSSIQFVSTDT